MFGEARHLHMFAVLYASVSRHMSMPGSAFLVEVHMDSGRLVAPYVASLGAFWPGMQALIGGCLRPMQSLILRECYRGARFGRSGP